MISLSLKLTTPTTWLTFNPLPPPLSLSLLLLPTFFNPNCNRRRIQDNSNQRRRGRRNGSCRAAGFSDDAPLAIAIGACALTSLVFPISPSPTDEDEDDDDDDDDADSVIDSTDTRLAVMGIISFIPYFNWLSWVFAWLDTGNRRYAVYAIVYLAPYLRSNLSLSPEESWLPVASIVFCIIHIQLEASIKNGDLQGFQLFNQAANRSSSSTRKEETRLKGHHGVSEEARTKDPMNLPASQDQSRDEIKGWGVPRKPLQDPKYLNEDEDANGGQKY